MESTPAEKKVKALFVDGGPRKNNNTAQMLQSAMKGASEAGAETMMVRLHDINFSGCKSCFTCQLKDSPCDGVCALKDDLRPVLEYARNADVIVIGSPVYFGFPTGETRSFMERLLFANFSYGLDEQGNRLMPFRVKRTAMIFTMNAPEQMMKMIFPALPACCRQLEMVFGHSEYLTACNTYQFSDYSRYNTGMINEPMKRRYRDEHFPIDLKNAYDLGKRLVEMDPPERKPAAMPGAGMGGGMGMGMGPMAMGRGMGMGMGMGMGPMAMGRGMGMGGPMAMGGGPMGMGGPMAMGMGGPMAMGGGPMGMGGPMDGGQNQ